MPDAHVTPGQFLVARKTLTSAQVLAIHTTPVTVIAAPGSGKALLPITALANYTFGTTAYTDGGGSLKIVVTSLFGMAFGATLGWWDQTHSGMLVVEQVTARSFGTVSAGANQPLTVENDTANPTLGDGTVTITVAYLVVPVS